jgi:hypothetical protein
MWFDLVVGIDIHVVGILIPPSPVPVPTPVPMPFVGMVFDPITCAVGAAIHGAFAPGPGLVLVNGLPVTLWIRLDREVPGHSQQDEPLRERSRDLRPQDEP